MAHPRERYTRRDFLKRSALGAAAVPSLAAILEACSNPRNSSLVSQGGAIGTGGISAPGTPYPLARQTAPVTWTIFPDREPIKSDLQPEPNATLQIYNWDQYIWKKVVAEFCTYISKKYNTKCNFQITTFNNMEEAYAKLQTGQLQFDIFFPTIDYLGKLLTLKLLQPLNLNYVTHLKSDVWPVYQNPFYDQGAHYTVPYTIYTTGIGFRADQISHDEISAMSNPWDIYWLDAAKYKGKIGIYDDYREGMCLALIRDGHIDDLNTTDSSWIQTAGQDLIQLSKAANLQEDINGAYVGIPHDQFVIHQAWSGDMVAAWFYVPHYTTTDFKTIGYWFPKDRVGPVNNDTIAIPQNAQHPVLAHMFLDWMLTFNHAMDNFSWVGYQPPQIQADPSTLTTTKSVQGEVYVFPWLSDAVVRQSDFQTGKLELELPMDTNNLWLSTWNQFKSGG
jgi:spermidine/putrescine transport system substrate-binding protein